MKKKIGKKKIIVAVVVVAVVAIAASQLLGGSEEIVNPVETQAASMGSLQQVIAIKGTIEGSDRAEIASSENREISQIYVKEGDRVTAGQVVATLKPSEQEESDNTYAKQQAKNTMELAKFDYEAKKGLYDEGAVSRQEMMQAKTEYDNSVSAYNALFDTKSRSEKNEITSPITGTVTRVNASVGLMANEIPGGEPLFVVENLDDLQMTVKVSEYDVGSISIGQTVTVSGQVLGSETVQGVVSRIAPTGEVKEAGSKEMVIPVTIRITEQNEHLIAGVSAKAEILTAEVSDALIVPLDAVVTDAMTEKRYVMVVEDGIAHKKEITIGLEGDFEAEILQGDVKEGDRLILNPSPELTDGSQVTDMTAFAGNDSQNNGEE